MITLLSGENDYELTKKIAQLKASFDGNAERFEGADLTKEQLADIFAGQTLFAMKRMIIIDNPASSPDLWQNLEMWVKRLNQDTTVHLIEPKVDKRTSAYKWLKKNVTMQEFPPIDTRDTSGLVKWLQVHADEKGLALTSQQARRLVDRAGSNQWELAHAVDKLVLAGEVTDQWIEDVIQTSPTENVFALFETVLNGQIERLQGMLQSLRQTEDPYRIMGLVNSQAMQLAVLTYGDGNVSKVATDTGASSSYAVWYLPWRCHRRARLVAVRNSQDLACCWRAQSSEAW